MSEWSTLRVEEGFCGNRYTHDNRREWGIVGKKGREWGIMRKREREWGIVGKKGKSGG